MRYQFLLVALMVVAGVHVAAPHAYAADMSASLARMDAIIKEMQSLRAEFALLSTTVVSPSVQPSGAVLGTQSSKPMLTQKLELGETNSDIKKIQKLLATDKEMYPYGVTSGMFGPKTEEGIKNFQTRFGLKSVGAVGPATKSLLELFFAAYPDDIYPADVLKKKPTVTVPAVVAIPSVSVVTPTSPISTGSNQAVSIGATKDSGGEAKVRIKYQDGTNKLIIVAGKTNTDIIDSIASRTGISKANILSIITFANDATSASIDDIKSITATIENSEASVKVRYTDGTKKNFTVDEEKKTKVIAAIADKLDIDATDVKDLITFDVIN